MILSENRNALSGSCFGAAFRRCKITAAFDFIPLAKLELFVAPAWQVEDSRPSIVGTRNVKWGGLS
jgi:hypothetical protein